MTDALYLKQMELGPMQNFVYLVGDREAGECVAVDPAWELDTVVRTAEADGMTIKGALITHTHPDHVGGALFGMDIPGGRTCSSACRPRSTSTRPSASSCAGFGSDLVKVEAGTELPVGRLTIRLHPHPGPHARLPVLLRRRPPHLGRHAVHRGLRPHRPAGRRSGRAAPAASTQRLAALPDETVLLPGPQLAGGEASTIGDEKRQNPFMRFGLADFLRTMGGGRIVLP